MSMMTNISDFLKEKFSKKIVKVYIQKGLSSNKYLAVDETSHTVLEVKNNKKVSQGQFYKLIFPLQSDDKKWIIVGDGSDVLQCAPFDFLTLSQNVIENYDEGQNSYEDELATPVSLQDAFNVPNKVTIVLKLLLCIKISKKLVQQFILLQKIDCIHVKVVKTVFASADLSDPKARKTFMVKDINGYKGMLDLWRNNCNLLEEGNCYQITNLKVLTNFI
jgi:hypothetical protein